MNSPIAKDIKRFFENSEGYHSINEDTDLFREVGLDSIQLVSFIAYLEQLRKAKIDVATLDDEDLRTINKIIAKYFQ